LRITYLAQGTNKACLFALIMPSLQWVDNTQLYLTRQQYRQRFMFFAKFYWQCQISCWECTDPRPAVPDPIDNQE
jgi:hypothetical protein